jgi:Mn-containing catalase
MSKGEDVRGPWNEGGDWKFDEDPQPAVDGDDGLATVGVTEADVEILQAMASRTASDVNANPTTGADLGAGQAIAAR